MATTTLKKLSEQVIRKLSGGNQNKDSQLDKREVIYRILAEINQALKIEYLTNIQLEDMHMLDGMYVTPVNLDVKKDAIRGEDYIEIPNPYINLPKGRGIHQISPTKDKCVSYVPLTNGMTALMRGLPCSVLEGRIGFYPEGNKVYFHPSPLSKGQNKVMIKLYAIDEDTLFLDPSMHKMIVDNTVMFFMNENMQDRVNDGSKVIRNIDKQ